MTEMAARDTPATRVARAAGVTFTLHEYPHEPGTGSYALEAVEALALDPERVLKTLVVSRREELVVCMLAAGATLDLRALGKHTVMAPVDRAERVTGYVAGGISPLGQRRRLVTFLDQAATEHPTVYVSAGRRGLEIELAPADLIALTGARVSPLRRTA